jgi:hypothetical protein
MQHVFSVGLWEIDVILAAEYTSCWKTQEKIWTWTLLLPNSPSKTSLPTTIFLSLFVQNFVLETSNPSKLVGGLALVLLASSGQTQSLVDDQVADERVARGADGDGQDDAEGDQLRGNLLEGAQTLGDGVGCSQPVCQQDSLLLVHCPFMFPSSFEGVGFRCLGHLLLQFASCHWCIFSFSN